MKYVQINTFPNGSTGAVMRQLAEERAVAGDECWLMWGRGRQANGDHEFNFGTWASVHLDALQTRVDGRAGFHSRLATRRLLKKLDEIRPDVVHLHNLHGYYINIEMLFDWLAKSDCQVKWTLHDCWAFTGHCAHFAYAGCEQWKTHCSRNEPCPQLSSYPKTISGGSCARNFERKRRIFSRVGTDRMTLVTPSHWLAGLIGRSFLADYAVEVRHNKVDTTLFRFTPSDFRDRYNIGDRFMVLGVASPWTEQKGLDDFLRLAQELDNSCVVVLVGLNTRQIKKAQAKGIVALPKVNSPEELAKIYSTSDVFFNPTKEDNYPTVNCEAEACGLPVVTYDVGGCAETLTRDESTCVSAYGEAFEVLRRMRTDRER